METERLILRKPKPDDFDEIFSARNSEFVLKYNAMKLLNKNEMMKEMLEQINRETVYCIEDKNSRDVIGMIDIHEDTIRFGTNTVEISYWINEFYARKGLMYEALEMVVYYLFHEKKISGITARCFKENQASIKLLNKLGFKKEGVLKNAVLGYRGIIYDDIIFYLHNPSICYVYMLRCKNGNLYTGWTNDLQKRIKNHVSKKGAKYTKAFSPCELVYYETYLDKETAMEREYEIKQLKKSEKEKLINGE